MISYKNPKSSARFGVILIQNKKSSIKGFF
jgi:hypothetical protein